MSPKNAQIALMAGWSVAVAGSLGARVAFGGWPGSVVEGLTWLALGCVPPLVMLLVFRGAPPSSIAQVLYDTENAAGATAPVARSQDGPRAARG